MPEYTLPAIMLLVAIASVAAAIHLPRVLSRSRALTTPAFEFGGRTTHKNWLQFRVRFAVLALLFGVFDMEMVYMFPWAVVFRRVGIVAFLDMFVFIAILTAAIIFSWRYGAFDWED